MTRAENRSPPVSSGMADIKYELNLQLQKTTFQATILLCSSRFLIQLPRFIVL